MLRLQRIPILKMKLVLMRPGSADIHIAAFGFIDYFVDGSPMRLPVQFIRNGASTLARIGCLASAPSYILVTPAMKAEAVGDMAIVADRYRSELASVIADTRSWARCLSSGACSLTLFRVLHSIRMHEQTVADAVTAAEALVSRLDRSERAAIAGISAFLAAKEESTARPPIRHKQNLAEDLR